MKRIKRVNELNNDPIQVLDRAEKFEVDFTKIKNFFASMLQDDDLSLAYINELRNIVEKEIIETSTLHADIKVELNKIHDRYKETPNEDEDEEKLVEDLESVESKISKQNDKLSEYLAMLDELYITLDKERDLINSLRKFNF